MLYQPRSGFWYGPEVIYSNPVYEFIILMIYCRHTLVRMSILLLLCGCDTNTKCLVNQSQSAL